MSILPKNLLSKTLRSISILMISSVLVGSHFLAPSLATSPSEEEVTKQTIFSKPAFKVPACISPLKSLPDEVVLQHIFLSLRGVEIGRLKSVCQEWKEISEKYIIWQLFGKPSPQAFFSSEGFYSKISEDVKKVGEQKHFVRMLIFGNNSLISKTYEFSDEQAKTIDYLVASSFQRIQTTSYPQIPLNLPNIKFMMQSIRDYAEKQYIGVKPKKPFLLLINNICNCSHDPFPVLQYVANDCKRYLGNTGPFITDLLAICDKKKGLEIIVKKPKHSSTFDYSSFNFYNFG